jgi:hypothetical protein
MLQPLDTLLCCKNNINKIVKNFIKKTAESDAWRIPECKANWVSDVAFICLQFACVRFCSEDISDEGIRVRTRSWVYEFHYKRWYKRNFIMWIVKWDCLCMSVDNLLFLYLLANMEVIVFVAPPPPSPVLEPRNRAMNTNFMGPSPCKTSSRLASQEFPRIVWNPRTH